MIILSKSSMALVWLRRQRFWPIHASIRTRELITQWGRFSAVLISLISLFMLSISVSSGISVEVRCLAREARIGAMFRVDELGVVDVDIEQSSFASQMSV